MTMSVDPVTVIILSRNRPLYLWACLDSLYHGTRHPARFVLVDNASDDPMVRRVVAGFERRNMFAAVEWHADNSPKRLAETIARYRHGATDFMVVIESDTVVFDTEPCWLTRMLGVMREDPKIGLLGSYIDPGDFVDRERARELEPGMDPARLDALIKMNSPERSLQRSAPEEAVVEPFNPPGRLIMFRKLLIDLFPFGLDSFVYSRIKVSEFRAVISTQVRHRHLSLLNIFDYPGYDVAARDAFVAANTDGYAIPPSDAGAAG